MVEAAGASGPQPTQSGCLLGWVDERTILPLLSSQDHGNRLEE